MFCVIYIDWKPKFIDKYVNMIIVGKSWWLLVVGVNSGLGWWFGIVFFLFWDAIVFRRVSFTAPFCNQNINPSPAFKTAWVSRSIWVRRWETYRKSLENLLVFIDGWGFSCRFRFHHFWTKKKNIAQQFPSDQCWNRECKLPGCQTTKGTIGESPAYGRFYTLTHRQPKIPNMTKWARIIIGYLAINHDWEHDWPIISNREIVCYSQSWWHNWHITCYVSWWEKRLLSLDADMYVISHLVFLAVDQPSMIISTPPSHSWAKWVGLTCHELTCAW